MLGDGCGPMISIRGVNKNFGALHVLRDIDLDIDRGQVVVVIGPSGSGKSTLCRVINRLETVDSGTISIDGEQLPVEGRKLAQLRSDVGMVFQSFNLFATSPGRRPARGPPPSWSESVWPTRRKNTRPSFPAVNSSGWRSHDRWRWTRK